MAATKVPSIPNSVNEKTAYNCDFTDNEIIDQVTMLPGQLSNGTLTFIAIIFITHIVQFTDVKDNVGTG